MKKSKLLWGFILATLFIFTACENPTAANPGGDTEIDEEDTEISPDRSNQVLDANGNTIGYILEWVYTDENIHPSETGPYQYLKVITEDGYIFTMNLQGKIYNQRGVPISDYGLFFDQEDLQGNACFVDGMWPGTPVYSKILYRAKDKLYTGKSTDGLTTPIITSDKTFLSYISNDNETIENTEYSTTGTYCNYIELEEVTDPELLSLLNIEAPISITVNSN